MADNEDLCDDGQITSCLIQFTVLIWLTGYITGAKVTRILEKTNVVYDRVFLPAPEHSSRV